MDTWLGIFPDEQPVTSLEGVERGATSLWIDGHARDFGALREFMGLETLSIYRFPRRHLPLLVDCDLPRLTALCLRHADIADLEFLSRFGTLETLTIWQSPKLKSLDGIETLTQLTALTLSEIGVVDSLAPLAALSELQSLSLTGGVWKTQGLPSLRPLAALTRLEQLDLLGSKVIDGDLSALWDLPLTHLALSARILESEELAGVAAAHPFWHRHLLDLLDFDQMAGSSGCKVCGTHRRVMFLRGKKLLWCPECEAKKLEALLADFGRLVEEKLRERQQSGHDRPANGRLAPT